MATSGGNLLAQQTMPTVYVTGERPSTDGGLLKCYSTNCLALFSMARVEPIHIDAVLGEDEYDREAFCDALSDSQPSGCPNSLAAAPRVPGINTSLADFLASPGVNGCGTGGLADIIASRAAGVAYGNFSGNLDEPVAGLNFRSACDAHDACFAQQRGFVTCNREFFDAMSEEINRHGLTPTSSIRYWAESYRNAYAAAVATDFGQDAYGAAAAAFACATWNLEMETNSCPRN